MRQGGNLGISPSEGLRWQPPEVAETTYLTAVGPNRKVGSAAGLRNPSRNSGNRCTAVWRDSRESAPMFSL